MLEGLIDFLLKLPFYFLIFISAVGFAVGFLYVIALFLSSWKSGIIHRLLVFLRFAHN